MSTLPTPRTNTLVLQHATKLDEAIAARSLADGIRTRNSFIDAISHLAMELERELAEAKAERDALNDALAFGQENCDAEYNRLRDERDEMTKVAQGACRAEGEALKREDRWRSLAEELAGALNFIVSECDWEEGTHTGDNRIGDACSKALARFRDAANPASVAANTGVIHRTE